MYLDREPDVVQPAVRVWQPAAVGGRQEGVGPRRRQMATGPEQCQQVGLGQRPGTCFGIVECATSRSSAASVAQLDLVTNLAHCDDAALYCLDDEYPAAGQIRGVAGCRRHSSAGVDQSEAAVLRRRRVRVSGPAHQDVAAGSRCPRGGYLDAHPSVGGRSRDAVPRGGARGAEGGVRPGVQQRGEQVLVSSERTASGRHDTWEHQQPRTTQSPPEGVLTHSASRSWLRVATPFWRPRSLVRSLTGSGSTSPQQVGCTHGTMVRAARHLRRRRATPVDEETARAVGDGTTSRRRGGSWVPRCLSLAGGRGSVGCVKVSVKRTGGDHPELASRSASRSLRRAYPGHGGGSRREATRVGRGCGVLDRWVGIEGGRRRRDRTP